MSDRYAGPDQQDAQVMRHVHHLHSKVPLHTHAALIVDDGAESGVAHLDVPAGLACGARCRLEGSLRPAELVLGARQQRVGPRAEGGEIGDEHLGRIACRIHGNESDLDAGRIRAELAQGTAQVGQCRRANIGTVRETKVNVEQVSGLGTEFEGHIGCAGMHFGERHIAHKHGG